MEKSFLKSLKAGISFIQETHLKKGSENRLKSNWITQMYQSTFSTKARGVAILIRKNVLFVHQIYYCVGIYKFEANYFS